MFEIGQKVVCVFDQWRDPKCRQLRFGYDCPLERGRTYVIDGFVPATGRASGRTNIIIDGVPNINFSANGTPTGDLGWGFYRFRPLIHKPNAESISESLKALKQLTVDCPPLVEGV